MDRATIQPPLRLAPNTPRWQARLLLWSCYAGLLLAAYMRFDASQPALGRILVLGIVAVMAGWILLFVRKRMPAIDQTVQDPAAREEFFQHIKDTKRAEWDRLRVGGRSRYVLRVGLMYTKLLMIPLLVLVVLVAPSGLMKAWIPAMPQSGAWMAIVLGVASIVSGLRAYRDWDRAVRGWAARDAELVPPSA